MRKRLVLLDEPLEGLAVIIVQGLLEVCRELVAQGQTIVIVEQNVRAALSLAHPDYVLDRARSFSRDRPRSCRLRLT